MKLSLFLEGDPFLSSFVLIMASGLNEKAPFFLEFSPFDFGVLTYFSATLNGEI